MKESASRVGQGILIVLLVVAAVVLSMMALKHTRQPVPEAGETPGYDPRLTVVEEVEEDTDEEEEPQSEEPEYEVIPATRVLTAFGEGRLMRALTAPCPMPETVVQTSFDNGVNWISQSVGALIPVTSPSRFVDTADGMAVLVGQDASDCSQQVAGIQAFGGELWDLVDVASFWRVGVTDPTVVNGPGGVVGQPGCEVARLSASASGRVAVLCKDATLSVSADNAATWTIEGGPIVGADAVEVAEDGVFVAAVDVQGCEGVQVARYDAALSQVDTSCAPAAATAGQTALSQALDGQLWLWAGDTLLFSADQGATWQQAQ